MLSEKYLDGLYKKLDGMESELTDMSRKIWENPEIGNEEHMACDLLATKLEQAGFAVERKAAKMDTAFYASKKASKPGPKVAFVAEYDALPEIGHACGHNLFSCAAVGAGIAIGEIIEELGGEIVVMGSPAEEGVVDHFGGKIYLINEGYFDGVDACFTFHSEEETVIERSLVTAINIQAEFTGLAVHAGGSPEKGINALTAGMLTLNNVNAMRQHHYPGDVINGIINDGGIVANTIPDYCKVSFSVRAKSRANLQRMIATLNRCVEAAALVTGCEYKIHIPEVNYDDTVSNHQLGLALAEVLDKMGVPYKQADSRNYAWDAGNISYVCPTLASYIKMGPMGIVCHTEEFKQAANSPEGYKGMMIGAKGMAATAAEFYVNEDLRKRVRHEFETAQR
ncbi:M20 family metallopeptidase [Tyzzerella sp. OttesenSCG-928-J15]|nr:M20 family metallopeptidase [Tyzzerella sp. OttesenSCG-928-J15]